MAEIYGQRVQTTVRQEYLPYVVDTVLNSNVLFQRIVRGSKPWKGNGGRTLRAPLKVSKNTTGQSYRGFDTFSVAATDNRQYLEFTPAWYQITCALPGDELSIADNDDKFLDLVKLTIQSDAEDMADDLGTILYADGTGNGSKDPLGLAALVDDGNAVSSLGGLSRSTYATLQSTVTASSGTISLAKVDTLWASATSGTQKPTAIYTTETIFNLYGQLLRPQERITKNASQMKGGLFGTTGFSALEYNGTPILMDEKCTSGAFIMVNENFVDFYALKQFGAQPVSYKSQIQGNDYDAPMGVGFSWSDWVIPANANGLIGHIYFGGQFITNNPKRHAKLTNITAI